MVWNQKCSWVAAVTLCAFGCNGANQRISRPELANRPELSQTRGEASDSPPPQILPSTHFAAGRMFESKGQLSKAIEQYRRAIAVAHDHQPAYHHLGLILSKLQQHDDAIAMLTRAVELRPDDAVTRNNLGFELMFEQRWSEATKHLNKAIELQPQFARAHINLGMIMSKVGRFDEALVHFRMVLPEQDAQYNLGLMHRAVQQYADAATAFNRALEQDSSFRAAQKQLDEIAPHLISAGTPVPPASTKEQVADVASIPEKASQVVPTHTVAAQAGPAAAPDDRTGDVVVRLPEPPCDAPDDIEAMIADGTLPAAPINLIEERPDWFTGEPFDEDLEDRTDQTLRVAAVNVVPDDQPCDEEEDIIEPDVMVTAMAELNDSFAVSPKTDEMAQMPFGDLNAEVARVDDEVRCLVEEAIELLAQSVDGRSETTTIGPIDESPQDNSIASVDVADYNEPARSTKRVDVPAIVPVADSMTVQLRTPSTTRQQVVEQNATTVNAIPTETVQVAGMIDDALPLDWRSRMRNFERRHGTLRSELDCLESLDAELTAERLAFVAKESNTPEPVVIPVTSQPRRHAVRSMSQRNKRTRTPLTSTYEPVLPEPIFGAPVSRTTKQAQKLAIPTPLRMVGIPMAAPEPSRNDEGTLTTTMVGPPAPQARTALAMVPTSISENRRTETTFDWHVQFGDLEEMTAIAANEIRCWDDLERNDRRFIRQRDPRKRFRKGAARPVKYNGRRNPFQKP